MRNNKWLFRAAGIVIVVLGLVLGSGLATLIASSTDPNRERISEARDRVEELENAPEPEGPRRVDAVLVTTPLHTARQELSRLEMKSAERSAGFMMGGLIGGGVLGVLGFILIAWLSRSSSPESPKHG